MTKAGIMWSGMGVAICLSPLTPAFAQPLTEKTMNLDAPESVPAGIGEFLFNHRLMVEDGHLENMPTFTLAYGATDRLEAAIRYATHSLINGQLNEVEPLVKLQLIPAEGSFGLAAIGAYNMAARSADGSLLMSLRFGALELQLAGRGYSSGNGVGGATAAAGAGLLWHLNPMLALSADYNALVAAQNSAPGSRKRESCRRGALGSTSSFPIPLTRWASTSPIAPAIPSKGSVSGPGTSWWGSSSWCHSPIPVAGGRSSIPLQQGPEKGANHVAARTPPALEWESDSRLRNRALWRRRRGGPTSRHGPGRDGDRQRL